MIKPYKMFVFKSVSDLVKCDILLGKCQPIYFVNEINFYKDNFRKINILEKRKSY